MSITTIEILGQGYSLPIQLSFLGMTVTVSATALTLGEEHIPVAETEHIVATSAQQVRVHGYVVRELSTDDVFIMVDEVEGEEEFFPLWESDDYHVYEVIFEGTLPGGASAAENGDWLVRNTTLLPERRRRD